MPIRYLPEAIRRVRSRITSGSVYVNTWTGVAFLSWTPQTSNSNTHILPRENTTHCTCYLALIEAHRVIQSCNGSGSFPFKYDFLNVQPRLADFRLIPDRQTTTTDEVTKTSPLFVQHKLNAQERLIGSPLPYVQIARRDKKLIEEARIKEEHLEESQIETSADGARSETFDASSSVHIV